MKYTPGPWGLYHETFRAELSPMKIIEIQDGRGKSIIKWPGFDGVDFPKKEILANARLIAAAPDLLEELRNIANANTKTWDDPDDFKVWAQSRARFAIAKAEVTP